MAFVEKVTRRLTYRPGSRKLIDQVLFVSFNGKQVSDSPLDICRELQRSRPDLKLIWGVTSTELAVPEGTKAVVIGSPEWFSALARSRYLVSNNNLPQYFRKRAGQLYLQTWHGTPLKRIGFDIKQNNMSAGYNAAMKREGRYWDYLVSPNEFSSAILPKAFGFGGRLLEFGYPRNDRLVTAKAKERNEIRASLGLSKTDQVVLYAPTWRDYAKDPQGRWSAVNNLEHAKLPSGFKLLYRGHSNTSASERALAEGTVDVTDYQDVTDLYLIADVLVTDYSSVMFDFSVTKKPMIFLCPDLNEYRDLRGFYFDFEAEAPGPIVQTSEQVLAALNNLPKVKKTFAAKYQKWCRKFNRLEDGKASARVVAEVFAV
ncbi:MAG: CDP-glycerol glycerophosphotransferase family protein [Micrococcales bacterium]